MLDANQLAKAIHDTLTPKKDGKGNPTRISPQLQNYAAGIIAALKAAIVSNVPGTITGVTAPGAPLVAGAGIGGVMIITPAPMLAKTLVGAHPKAAPNIQKENIGLIGYIGTGLITFAPGSITGTCTNTPVAPGPLVAGAGTGGQIIGLTGAAALLASGTTGPTGLKHYTSIVNYIMANAQVTYASGSVVGVCPPGGGPLAAGAGIGGTIS